MATYDRDLLSMSPEQFEISLAPIKPLDDPQLKAIFGPLRLLTFDSPKEYSVGRTPDNDFVLKGKYATFTSRSHCKLVWDGSHMTITDLQSLNGTWVNQSRLADGEVRILHHRDTVAFTPLPIDNRPIMSGRRAIGREFWECSILGRDALEFEYHEYGMGDDFETMATLSPAGRAVRRSLAELDRIRNVIRHLPSSRGDSRIAASRQDERVAQTYRGSLDRPDRPLTPFYIPPLPIDLTPELHDDKQFRRADFVIPGREDPNGLLADHPNIIWHNGVRYKHIPGIRPPPCEMLHWSNYYNLPVGLHIDWPLFSSVPYGVRPPAQASLPPHTRREDVYATFRWPLHALLDGTSDLESVVPASPPAAAPLEMPLPPSIPHHSHHRALGELHALSSVASAEIMRSALPVSGLGLASSASASHSGGSSGPIVGSSLKRPRTPDDDAAERPAKRVALAASIPADRVTSSCMLARISRSPSPSTLSPLEPMRSSPRRNLVSEPIHDPSSSLASVRVRTPQLLDSTSSVLPHVPVDALIDRSMRRKRKRQTDTEPAADEDVAEVDSLPMAQAVTSDGTSPEARRSDSLRVPPSYAVPKKRRRVAQPAAPTRRSLRVRKNAATTVRGS
ncbi:hypothetical protein PENSPDRAFT_751741 [Peniophora sp. CONT]|nr:hypothetical protein PENSPDRAFT_751741 [Peniophora sp. CONT]